MMGTVSQNSRFLLLILAFGFVAMVWDLSYNSPYHDEALNIRMGRQVLAGESCPACAQNTGSVIIQPVIAAVGDAAGGILGARMMGVLFGLGLTVVLYATSRRLLSEKHALLCAALFLFSGPALYLSKLATYDIIAAFFLGLSFMLIVQAEKVSKRVSWLLLLCGSLSLLLAAMSKYVVSVFVVPLIILVLCRQRPSRALLFFIIPFAAGAFLYGYLALYPVWGSLSGSVGGVYSESQKSLYSVSSWTIRWVAMPYLLATFALFHSTLGKKALLLILLSTPIILLHIITGAEQSVNKNVIFALVFLVPAAAIGVDHMGSLFSGTATSGWVKPFFTATVLIVLWAFGLQEMRWLERQYPDLTPVISFFREQGHDNMTVVIDSDFGDATYAYALENRFPHAKFVPITEFMRAQWGMPDFIILDGYYEKKPLREKAMEYISANGYRLLRTFSIKLSWGLKNVSIFGRQA